LNTGLGGAIAMLMVSVDDHVASVVMEWRIMISSTLRNFNARPERFCHLNQSTRLTKSRPS
jgi:hypothetical protein